MDIITQDELRSLFGERETLCVSLFMPTHRAGREIRQDPIRLKNLLRDAEERLLANGLPMSDVTALLAPARRPLHDSRFWRYQSDGLAVFLSRGFFRCYRLPNQFPELVVVADRFHVKPLLPLFTGGGRFYLLALSQNEVKLFEGAEHAISLVSLEGLPHDLRDALRPDGFERGLQSHTGAPGGTGKGRAMFHGHGEGVDDAKTDLLRYFRQINRSLHGLLGNQHAPLVLAGVEYLFPIYKEANTYPGLQDEGIPGNAEALSVSQLHAAAWSIVQRHFAMAQKQAMAQYEDFGNADRRSSDVREVVAAAYRGAIESVWVPVGVQIWGRVDPDGNTTCLHEEWKSGDEDLLNLIAVHTIVNGGRVYAVLPSAMPEGAHVAALFRYGAAMCLAGMEGEERRM